MSLSVEDSRVCLLVVNLRFSCPTNNVMKIEFLIYSQPRGINHSNASSWNCSLSDSTCCHLSSNNSIFCSCDSPQVMISSVDITFISWTVLVLMSFLVFCWVFTACFICYVLGLCSQCHIIESCCCWINTFRACLALVQFFNPHNLAVIFYVGRIMSALGIFQNCQLQYESVKDGN